MSEQLRAVIRQMISSEEVSSWSTVRKVPSTWTWRAIDHLASLTPTERQLYFDAVAATAPLFFEPSPPRDADAFSAPALRGFHDALMQMSGDDKYLGARMLRMILGDVTGKRPTPVIVANTPREVLDRAAAIEPVSAAQIRKRMKSMMSDRFGAKPQDLTAGGWSYAGSWNGQAFELLVDSGGSNAQLRYHVNFVCADLGLQAKRLVYERMIGMGAGHWDFVTATNLDESIDILGTLVTRLVDIPTLLKNTL